MKRSVIAAVILPLSLAGCGSVTVPAAVKMTNGEALTGTTTASMSGGTFQVSSPTGAVNCSGNYDAFDTNPTISAPVRCSDGRYGTITVLRSQDGGSGTGTVTLADGSTGNVAFGRAAASVIAYQPPQTLASADMQPANGALVADTSPTTDFPSAPGSTLPQPQYAALTGPLSTTRATPRVYTGNCPTADSIAADGKRCGRRSAEYRAGGYDGYGSWASAAPRYTGGSTYVRGYFRKNGTYVRGHTRRR